MTEQYNFLNELWEKSDEEIIDGLVDFGKRFNKDWIGDNKRFLYIKVFKTATQVGEFIDSSVEMTNKQKEFENEIGLSLKELQDVYLNVGKDKKSSTIFKNILLNKLSETL